MPHGENATDILIQISELKIQLTHIARDIDELHQQKVSVAEDVSVIKQRLTEMETKIATAFIGGDESAHREDHIELRQSEQEKKDLGKALKETIITNGSIWILTIIALAVWQYIIKDLAG